MFKHSDGRHNLLQGHLEHFQLTSPKVSISLRFPMQKKVFSLLSHWIVWFSSFVRPRKLFRNCLTNSRFLRRLFKFLIVYKKSVVPHQPKLLCNFLLLPELSEQARAMQQHMRVWLKYLIFEVVDSEFLWSFVYFSMKDLLLHFFGLFFFGDKLCPYCPICNCRRDYY